MDEKLKASWEKSKHIFSHLCSIPRNEQSSYIKNLSSYDHQCYIEHNKNLMDKIILDEEVKKNELFQSERDRKLNKILNEKEA